MKVFGNISKFMQRFATKKYIIPLLIMFIIIIILMEISPIGKVKLKEMSGGAGMLDMQFGYSQLQVYDMLGSIGTAGRLLYMRLLGLDFIFAVIFMLLQSLLITALLQKAQVSHHWYKLNLLPFVKSALDILENCFILLMLFNYPTKFLVIVCISSVVTILKWIIYGVVIAITFTLGALTSHRSILSKIEKRKYKELRGTI
jgi:hypothetical protein